MCLSIEIHRPDDVLARGEHAGFEWAVTHNGIGYRCGYVRVPAGHPWHGKDYGDVDAEVHGGLTFAGADEPCGRGDDDAWWLGFDMAHFGDAPDPSLTVSPGPPLAMDAASPSPLGALWRYNDVVRTQEYAEAECRKLCEQAKAAAESVAVTA